MKHFRKNKEKLFAFQPRTFGWQILGVIFLLLFSVSYQTVQAQISQEVVLTEAEKNWIAEHPVIRATNKTSGAPIDFMQDGKPAGFSIDYLNLVAEKIGVKIDYVNGYDWRELQELLKERKIDVTHSLTPFPEHDEYLIFTKTYLNSQRVYYGQKGAKPIRYVNDFVGKKIGIVKGTKIAASYKTKFLQINLVEFDTLKQALTELSEGKVDIVTSGFQNSNFTISENSIPNVEVIGPDIFVDTANDLRLAFRNDWPMLGPILEKGMAAISQEEIILLKEVAASTTEQTMSEPSSFLEENKSKPGIEVTESGLQYKVLLEGAGERPMATDNVTVHYEGTLLDGTKFDSSYDRGQPAEFPLNRVIAGWTEGVQLMKEGAKYKFFIPSALAYGPRGTPGGPIGPNEDLIFTVELIRVN